MRKFNCDCFSKDAICNINNAALITVWRDINNPNEDGQVYYKDIIYCPVCGTKTTIIEGNE